MRPGPATLATTATAVLLILLLPGALLPNAPTADRSSAPHTPGLAPRTVPPVPLSRPASAPLAAAPAVRQVDHTAIGPLGSLPTSDVVETPPPELPPTSPTTFVVASEQKCGSSGGCTPSLNITAPAGPWALILLNFTGQVVAGVYDSSFHAMIDDVPVLFGTTPENSSWTVLKNLTEYSVLFDRAATFQFVLGEAVTTGYFLLNVSLSFYPEPAGVPGPVVPNEIVPLWPFTGVKEGHLLAETNATVPEDVVNATLEMYAYGFGSEGGDEFWYTLSQPYREVNVTVGGTPLADILPFEYINTGGISLFLWDPVTGAYTVNDPPYEVDVTSALGLLEGTHEYNATITGEGTESQDSWFIAGSLLLYTSADYGGASLISEAAPPPTIVHTRSNGVPVDYENDTLAFSSSISANGSFETVSSSTNVTFRALIQGAGNAVSGTSTTTETIRSAGGVEWINSTSSPSMAFTSTGTEGTPYTCGGDTCVNATSVISSLFQNWNTTRTDTYVPFVGLRHRTATYADDNVSANDNWSGLYIETSGGTELGAIYYKWANTTKTYDSLVASDGRSLYFDHLIRSVLVPSDENAAAVVADTYSYDDLVSISQSNATTESGTPDTFTAHPLGFGAPFTYVWSGLPTGCTTTSTSTNVTCRAGVVENYTVSVEVVSYLGQTSPPVSVLWVNLARLTPELSIAPPEVDLGRPAYLNLSYSGGVAPINCSWTADGLAIGAPAQCDQRVVYTATSTGTVNITVELTDALGVSAVRFASIEVVSAPTVYVTISPPSTTTVPVLSLGSTLALTANVLGGIAPYTFAWYQNGDPIPVGGQAQNYSFEAITNGNYSFTVYVTDADGTTVPSTSVEVEVPASSSHATQPKGNSTPSSSGLGAGTEALIGVGVVGVVVVVALVALTRRRPPPAAAMDEAAPGDPAEPPP